MNSKKYWEQRAEETALFNCKKTEDYIKSLENHYKKVLKVLEKNLQDIYKKYSDDEGKLDLVAIKQYISINDSRTKEKITRMEYLQRQILNEIKKFYNAESETLKELLKQLYNDNYYSSLYQLEKHIGVHTAFDKLDTKAIEIAVKEPWSGKSYSKRLWKHQTKLENSLKDILPTGIILGESNDEMARRLKNAMDTKFKYAKRLIRTETNYVSNQATLKSYEELGVHKYKYLAVLDRRTSKICGELDCQVFDVEDAQVGVNYPPLHPHCRSTTVPDMEDTFTNHRLAKDSEDNYYKIPRDMTYQEWYEKYVKGNEKEELARKKDKNLYADKKQYIKYKEVLGKTIPRSFEKFQDLKYNDANKWDLLKSEYKKKKVLTSKEEQALTKYLGSESYIINEKLRNNSELQEHETEMVKYLDKALNKLEPFEGTVTRSLQFFSDDDLNSFLNKHIIDKPVQYKAYTSSTVGKPYNDKGQVEIFIESRTGKNIIKYNPAEKEILFKRDTKFKVINVVLEDGKYYINLKEL